MKRLLLTLFTIFTTLTGLSAQSAEEAIDLIYDTQGFGIRAQSMGNAFTAVADDYSAIYWNPAGLAQIRHGEIYGSLYNYNFQTEATYQGNTITENQAFTKLGSFGLVVPFPVARGSFVISLGYQRIKDLGSYLEFQGVNPGSNNLAFDISNDFGSYGVLPFDSLLQERQTKSNDGALSQFSFGGAIDLSPRFSAGLTLNIYGGDNTYTSDYAQDDINNTNNYIFNDINDEFYYNYYDVHQKLTTNYSGWEAKVGGLFRLTNQLRLGGTITLPMTLTVEEEWSVDDELSYDIVREDGVYNFVETADLGSGTFDYEIKVPFKFSAGIAYQTPRFLISAAADYRDWTQMKYDMPDNRDQRDYADLLNENNSFREYFQPSLAYGVGGEISLMQSQLKLRGGYRVQPTPLKNVDSKYDRQYLSAGIGFLVDKQSMVEVSYVTGLWENDRFHYYDWNGPLMETSEKYTTSKITFGMRIKF
ncbi:MAG: hypothetical protein GF313_12630 [Caldithrix sp.]|nr:hypothetical protein [Caldithrix sp.]